MVCWSFCIKLNTVCKWLEILLDRFNQGSVTPSCDTNKVQWHLLSHPLILYSVTIKEYTQSSPHSIQCNNKGVHSVVPSQMTSHNLAVMLYNSTHTVIPSLYAFAQCSSKGVHALVQRVVTLYKATMQFSKNHMYKEVVRAFSSVHAI